MATKYYSPSINIIRDKDQSLEYIPTRNGERAFNSIINAYENGVKSFCLIGAYGTGKSAFILALDDVLNGRAEYFTHNMELVVTSKFIIGEYNSFEQKLRSDFKIADGKDTLEQLQKVFNDFKKRNETLLFVVDEFGKHLEYAASHSAEKEMFFFQKLAELVNSKENDVILITTLHQPFEGYSSELSDVQKKEWSKVSGRYVEVPFNEPVEQLLYLAGEHIKQMQILYNGKVSDFESLFFAIQDSKAFPLKDYFSQEFALSIFPFDLLSASTLILAFQAYGQNERSLFNFLKADDYLGLQDFDTNYGYFSLPEVYEYLNHNFFSSISSKYNPHILQWRALRDAIIIAESVFDENLSEILKLIKTIGLLNIFGKPGQVIDKEFLKVYAKYALDIDNTESYLVLLEGRQIIRYQEFSSRYVLFKGTDFDISQALIEANSIVSKDFNFIDRLEKYFTFPVLQAKRYYYVTGTPRYFEFKLSESIKEYDIKESVDGYIQLLINDHIDEKHLEEHSKRNNPMLYGWLRNSEQIKDTIFEIEKVKWVKEQSIDDQVVQKELDSSQDVLIDKLNILFTEGFYGIQANVKWYYKGEPISFSSSRDLNRKLSEICEDFYPKVPLYKNESINRQKVQGTISAARRTLISHLLAHAEDPFLGFEEDRFPPQKTIYQSLIRNSGIHREENGRWGLHAPLEDDFNPLWNECETFFNECAVSPKKLSVLIEKLKLSPFGLKMGFIETWVPLYLIIKQQEFAFYEEDQFIQDLAEGTIDVAMKQPQKYFIHTFKLSKEQARLFNQYRYFLKQVETEQATRDTFIETVKPFLSFYKRLTDYTKQTEMLSKNAIRLKSAIREAKDAEKVFFEDIPRALGYSGNDFLENDKIEQFAIRLNEITSEISGAQSKLFDNIENIINSEIGDSKLGFPENKERLQKRFKKLKLNELNTIQKVFYQRIVTALDDRKSWISSIAFAVTNKTLDSFTDKDYELFVSKYPRFIHELDNLTELSKKDVDQENEEVLKLEITSFVKGVQNRLVRLPKSKSKNVTELEERIKPILSNGNKQENIALLIKLLQNEIENE